MQMKVEMEIPDQLIHDLLVTAQEHSGYWCYDSNMSWKDESGEYKVCAVENRELDQIETCTLWVEEYNDSMYGGTGERISLDLQKGLNLAAAHYPQVLNENELDAETADIFLQLAAFGELVYG